MLSLMLACLSFAIIGCKDITAPNLGTLVELPPFYQQVMTIWPTTLCPNCINSNTMKFYTAVGVDPVVDATVKDISTNSPHIVVVWIMRRADPELVCETTTCTKTPWIIEVAVQAATVGEAEITVSLRANPDKKSSFRVISSTNGWGGKG
jgi:hypothetical protein